MWWTNPSKRWEIVSKCMDSTKPAESAGLAAMYMHGVGRDVMKHLASMPGIKPHDVLPSLSHVDFSDLVVEFGKAIGNDAAAEAVVSWHWDAARGADDVAKRLCAHGISVPVALARAGDIYGVPPEQDSQFVAVAKAATNEEQTRRAGLTFVSRWAAGLAADDVIEKAVADRFIREGEYVDVRRDNKGQFAPKPKGMVYGGAKEKAPAVDYGQEKETQAVGGGPVYGGQEVRGADADAVARRKKRRKESDKKFKEMIQAAVKRRQQNMAESVDELKSEAEAFDVDSSGDPPWVTGDQGLKRRNRFKQMMAMRRRARNAYKKYKTWREARVVNVEELGARVGQQEQEAIKEKVAALSPGKLAALKGMFFVTYPNGTAEQQAQDETKLLHDYAVYRTGYTPLKNIDSQFTDGALEELAAGKGDLRHWPTSKEKVDAVNQLRASFGADVYDDRGTAAWRISIPLWAAYPAIVQNQMSSFDSGDTHINMGRINTALIEAGDEPVTLDSVSKEQLNQRTDSTAFANRLAPLTYKNGQWHLNMIVPVYSMTWMFSPMTSRDNEGPYNYVSPMPTTKILGTTKEDPDRQEVLQAIAPHVNLNVTGAARYLTKLTDAMNIAALTAPSGKIDELPSKRLATVTESLNNRDYQPPIDAHMGVISEERQDIRNEWESQRNELNDILDEGIASMRSLDRDSTRKNWDGFRAAAQHQQGLLVRQWIEETWSKEAYKALLDSYVTGLKPKRTYQMSVPTAFEEEDEPLAWDNEGNSPYSVSRFIKEVSTGLNPFIRQGQTPKQVHDTLKQKAAALLVFQDMNASAHSPNGPVKIANFDVDPRDPGAQRVVRISSDDQKYQAFNSGNVYQTVGQAQHVHRTEPHPFGTSGERKHGDVMVVTDPNNRGVQYWVWEPDPIEYKMYMTGQSARPEPPLYRWKKYGTPTSESQQTYDAVINMINQAWYSIDDSAKGEVALDHVTQQEIVNDGVTPFKHAMSDVFARKWAPNHFPSGESEEESDDMLMSLVSDLVGLHQDEDWIGTTVLSNNGVLVSDMGDTYNVTDNNTYILQHLDEAETEAMNSTTYTEPDLKEGRVLYGDAKEELVTRMSIPRLKKQLEGLEYLLRAEQQIDLPDGERTFEERPGGPGDAEEFHDAYGQNNGEEAYPFEKYGSLISLHLPGSRGIVGA